MARTIPVDITPDKSLIKKLGLVGYRTEQAVAELVDNSIDARIEGEACRISLQMDFGRRQVTVTDDCLGMNLPQLRDALTVARETKKDGSLGRFGMGMKGACSSLGKAFSIVTSRPGPGTKLVARYDEDQWLGDGSRDWTNFEIEESDKSGDWHGTKITISKLKVPLYSNQLSNFRKRFAIRYGPYLRDGRARIAVNSKDCRPAEPELEEGTRQDVDVRLPSGGRIAGWVGLLRRRSIKGDYGMHLYRRGRLIRAFDKFGIRSHPEMARVVGEISIDHVPVNFHKTGFLKDSLEYEEAVKGFGKDPAVLKCIRDSPSRKQDSLDIRRIFADDAGSAPLLDARMSAANAWSLLRRTGRFAVRGEAGRMDVAFEDAKDGGIYGLDFDDDGLKITVNRSSEMFMIFKNPLLLLSLVRVESELVAGNPARYADFVRDRNRRWGELVGRLVADPAPRRTGPRNGDGGGAVLTPAYSPAGELVDLHGHLTDAIRHGFQFTGLSTLAPFLHNAYGKMIYVIHTVPGAGQQVLEAVQDHAGGFVALLEPKPAEVDAVLGISGVGSRLIIIREYAERPATTWAPPEKAWLDLYSEVRRGTLTMYGDELDGILSELLRSGLASEKKLRSLARRRKLLDGVDGYLGGGRAGQS
ncbi:MAG: ATP-binding protein [Thaumarchaeota archaeon]|nr:ATP-binding protein [Nitrososphaerota archaeon]